MSDDMTSGKLRESVKNAPFPPTPPDWWTAGQPEVGYHQSSDRIIWTPQGYYVPAHLADRLPIAEPAPAYNRPDDVMRAGMVGNYPGTPIYILPPTPVTTPPRWWVRAWRRLTRRGRRAQT